MSRESMTGVAPRGFYFFVSYARVPPPAERLASGDGADGYLPDQLVENFFQELSGRVASRAGDTRLGIGLYDRSGAGGPDLNAALARALGVAEVLVPLVSPRYVQPGSWAMRELESFRRRLSRAPGDTSGHIQHVLWLPLPPGDRTPGGVAHLGRDIPEYEEYGLGALSDLPRYRPAYVTIMDRLADNIVQVAQHSPLGPSPAPLPEDRPTHEPLDADLVIAVLAPTARELPPTRRRDGYGSSRSDWSPFLDARPLPVAQQAATIAERLDLATMVVDLPGSDAALRALQDRPGLLLVDPWITATPAGRTMLRERLAGIPSWTTVVVVSDGDDEQFPIDGERLHRAAIAMLDDVGVAPSVRVEIQRSEQFMRLMPAVLTQARRGFLKSRPSIYSGRPRFGDVVPGSSHSQEAPDQ
jgi:FxsC-like protein